MCHENRRHDKAPTEVHAEGRVGEIKMLKTKK